MIKFPDSNCFGIGLMGPQNVACAPQNVSQHHACRPLTPRGGGCGERVQETPPNMANTSFHPGTAGIPTSHYTEQEQVISR